MLRVSLWKPKPGFMYKESCGITTNAILTGQDKTVITNHDFLKFSFWLAASPSKSEATSENRG